MSKSRHKRNRKRIGASYVDIELNVMPFIDVFSLLNTFLLFSAVFLSTGIQEVQIPFLSTEKPKDEDKDRMLSVKVDVSKETIELVRSWSAPPEDEKKESFPNTVAGHNDLHARLVKLRADNPETDKLTLFCEDDVIWDNINTVLDAVKLRRDGDPEFPSKDKKENADGKIFVYPKVVMGSVMLR